MRVTSSYTSSLGVCWVVDEPHRQLVGNPIEVDLGGFGLHELNGRVLKTRKDLFVGP